MARRGVYLRAIARDRSCVVADVGLSRGVLDPGGAALPFSLDSVARALDI
jgi:hypothetical protein